MGDKKPQDFAYRNDDTFFEAYDTCSVHKFPAKYKRTGILYKRYQFLMQFVNSEGKTCKIPRDIVRIGYYTLDIEGDAFLADNQGNVIYNISGMNMNDVIRSASDGSYKSRDKRKSLRTERTFNKSRWSDEINRDGLIVWMNKHPKTPLTEILFIVKQEGMTLDLKTGICR